MRFLLAIALVAVSSEASAYCSEPTFWGQMPTPPGSYERPRVPYCLTTYRFSNTHTCSQWELDSYFDDVDDHAEDMQAYYDEVLAFARRVSRHVDEAFAYAECEVNEVSRQHR